MSDFRHGVKEVVVVVGEDEEEDTLTPGIDIPPFFKSGRKRRKMNHTYKHVVSDSPVPSCE